MENGFILISRPSTHDVILVCKLHEVNLILQSRCGFHDKSLFNSLLTVSIEIKCRSGGPSRFKPHKRLRFCNLI